MDKLTFPVGYGAVAPAVAALTGAFINPDPVYLQSTGFVLDPAGNVAVSVYSSGAIGRLIPDDVIGDEPLPARALGLRDGVTGLEAAPFTLSRCGPLCCGVHGRMADGIHALGRSV